MAALPFWTPERDDVLRTLWTQHPVVRLVEIKQALGNARTVQAISKRAHELGLKPRHVYERGAGVGRKRPSRANQDVKPQAANVVSKVLALEAPCPFYLGHGETCGVMVNRRKDALGNRPSQYCTNHRGHVTPLSRGTIGTLATYAKGVKYG